MKFFTVLASAALAATACAEIDIVWSDCGTAKNHVKITNVTWSPNPAKPGDNITVTGLGTLDEDITDSKLTLTLGDIVKHSFDGCKGATIEAPLNLATIVFPPQACPIQKGPRWVRV
jgi:hypothetical protein